jgi:hypothetical protein
VDPAEIRRIMRGHDTARREVRRQLADRVGRLWDSLDNYRDERVDRFARQAAAMVTGGQRQAAELEQAFQARLASAVRGQRVRPAGVNPDSVSGAAARGVDPREVYRRPGKEVWTALSAGAEVRDAIGRGRRRAVSKATTDVQLVRRNMARRVLADDQRVVGYRRVLRGDACELCAGAADQLHDTDELMPIHPGCDCGIAAVHDDADPTDAIDGQRQQARADVQVREHGELGPTLAQADHQFTDAGDL